MPEPTPTQEASRETAAAVFQTPHLRKKFELMAEETATREPVADDFKWLSRGAAEASVDEYSKFEALARKIIGVPKSAIDSRRSRGR